MIDRILYAAVIAALASVVAFDPIFTTNLLPCARRAGRRPAAQYLGAGSGRYVRGADRRCLGQGAAALVNQPPSMIAVATMAATISTNIAASKSVSRHIALSRIGQLDQRTALPDQCLHSAEADVRPPRRKSGFDPTETWGPVTILGYLYVIPHSLRARKVLGFNSRTNARPHWRGTCNGANSSSL